MGINQETLNKLATLARLKLSPDQTKAYQAALEQCLHHFDQMAKMPLTEEPPPFPSPHPLRDDHPTGQPNAQEAVRPSTQASTSGDHLFKVPKVMDS